MKNHSTGLRAASVYAVFLTLIALPAVAERVPDSVLARDYAACMGGENPQQDPARGKYCACIRDSMRNWDMRKYGEVAMAQAHNKNPAQPTAEIQSLAQACFDKALR